MCPVCSSHYIFDTTGKPVLSEEILYKRQKELFYSGYVDRYTAKFYMSINIYNDYRLPVTETLNDADNIIFKSAINIKNTEDGNDKIFINDIWESMFATIFNNVFNPLSNSVNIVVQEPVETEYGSVIKGIISVVFVNPEYIDKDKVESESIESGSTV